MDKSTLYYEVYNIVDAAADMPDSKLRRAVSKLMRLFDKHAADERIKARRETIKSFKKQLDTIDRSF